MDKYNLHLARFEVGERRWPRNWRKSSSRSSGDLCPQEKKTENKKKEKRKSRAGWMMEVSKWRRNLNQNCPPVWPVLFALSCTLALQQSGRHFLYLPVHPASANRITRRDKKEVTTTTQAISKMDQNYCCCYGWAAFDHVLLWWLDESGGGGR